MVSYTVHTRQFEIIQTWISLHQFLSLTCIQIMLLNSTEVCKNFICEANTCSGTIQYTVYDKYNIQITVITCKCVLHSKLNHKIPNILMANITTGEMSLEQYENKKCNF